LYEYRVPFSTKEDKKLIFNLTTHEFMSIMIGGVVGLAAAGIAVAAFHIPFLLCLPLAVPFVGGAAYMAFKKLKKVDMVMTFGSYLYKKLCFKIRPKHYILFRK
jgi:hypothetical protein